MDKIIVGIAEGKIARGNQVLVSYALGSCVGVCLYDRQEHVAGMAHIILPGREYSALWDNAYKFADEGIHELMNQMKSQGARPAGLIAKIAGGARMFGASAGKMDIGQQNVAAVRKSLAREGIRLVAQDTGHDYGRTILFYAENGRLEVNTVRHTAVVL